MQKPHDDPAAIGKQAQCAQHAAFNLKHIFGIVTLPEKRLAWRSLDDGLKTEDG
jgi:hypothetical protein